MPTTTTAVVIDNSTLLVAKASPLAAQTHTDGRSVEMGQQSLLITTPLVHFLRIVRAR